MARGRDRAGAPLVIASYLPGEGHFESERFQVAGVECRDDYDYWAGLAALWDGPDTIVNIEHDVEVTDEHIAQLLDCPHPLCTWPYICHWISSGLAFPLFGVGTGKHRLWEPEEWAHWSVIGLVKITAAARTGPLRRETWQRVELAIESAVALPWHVHWRLPGSDQVGVNHHHW
jgi:hypothetical protein